MRLRTLAALALISPPLLPQLLKPLPDRPDAPKTWVDKDTGHRVWRITDEPNSGGFYFNVNAYTPDGKQMIYTAPDGIHVHGHGHARRPGCWFRIRRGRPTPRTGARLLPCRAWSTRWWPDTRPTASSTPRPIRNRRDLGLQGRHQHRRHPQAGRPAGERMASSASMPMRRSPPEPISRAMRPANRSTAQNAPPRPHIACGRGGQPRRQRRAGPALSAHSTRAR